MKDEFPVATLPAPGVMAVDWDERVNFDRLGDYCLERTREQVKAAGVGALLLFETSNIRCTTSTSIGYWAFNKSERWAVVTETGQPKVWDSGSAARAHPRQLPSL